MATPVDSEINHMQRIQEVRHDYLIHMSKCLQHPPANTRWIIGYQVYDGILNDLKLCEFRLNYRKSTLFGSPYKAVGYIGLNEIYYLNEDDTIIFKVDFNYNKPGELNV